MNLIDFTKEGGYRFKQPTLNMMQMAYFEILEAFMKHLNVQAENTIISGCEVAGANITEGMLFIGGELCKFYETAGTLESLIYKKVEQNTLAFEDGSNPIIFRSTKAVVHLVEGTALSQFTRIENFKSSTWNNISNIPGDLVLDAEYVHTDNNYTNVEAQKLEGIEANAQVNVKTDWDAAPGADNELLNKPVGNLLTYLHKATAVIGDLNGDFIEQITFPSVGTANYMPLVTIISNTGPRFFAVFDKTQTGFKIQFENEGNVTENISLDYCLIPL